MPRKKDAKHTITVMVNGKPITVSLHPPTGNRKTWFAYWNGLVSSKSTGQRKLEDAIVAAEDMVKNGGKRANLGDTVLSDEEFEEIQRVHYSHSQDQTRAVKSLKCCLEAIRAFREISGLKPITSATADDCAAFQRKALQLPKNWRLQYPKSKNDGNNLSPSTVNKWIRSLRASFERANTNAGRKCVRGVVPENKLLSVNPWDQFTWVEASERALRQFDGVELISILDFLEMEWSGVSAGVLLAKVCLWSSERKEVVTSLKWSSYRLIGNEHHFEVVGKCAVERWFRLPDQLVAELMSIKTKDDFVFAAYNEQIRQFHLQRNRPGTAGRVADSFHHKNLADWFSSRLEEWSATLPNGHAYPHVFRKTTLQYARSGEDINRQVAQDARVTESVMMTNYVKETDEQMRQASNRTFARILASLPPEVAHRYGYREKEQNPLELELKSALAEGDWKKVAELSARLAEEQEKDAS